MLATASSLSVRPGTPDRDENTSPSDAQIKCEPIQVPLSYEYHHVEMWDTDPDKVDRVKGGKVQDTFHLEVGESPWVSNENAKSVHEDYNKIPSEELHQFHDDGVGDGCEVGNKK